MSLNTAPLRYSQISGPLLIALLSIIIFMIQEWSKTNLAFSREAILNGQIWRLISANLVHTNGFHLLLNLAGLALLWILHGYSYSIQRFLIVWVVSALAVTLGILIFNPEMRWYAGLSGVIHGLFIWGCAQDIRAGMLSGWILLLGIFAKIAIEQFNGGQVWLAELIEASVAVDAHLYGAIGGIISLIGLAGFRQLKKSR